MTKSSKWSLPATCLPVQVEKVYYWPMVEVPAFNQTNWRNFAGKTRLKMKITDSENEF
jgi:hypothetical protein